MADTYPNQNWIASPKGEVPIHLIDLNTDEEQMICSVPTDVGNNGKTYKEDEQAGQYKLDPHLV